VSGPAAERGAFVVPAALDRERVDRVVALVTGCSRSEAQELVAAGLVHVEGRPVAKSRRLHQGEQVEVTGEPERRGLPQPEDLPIDVRYEDDDVLVIAKPAGLVVHPGAGHHDGTLVNALLHRYPGIAGVGDPERPGIVHRLDVDTSGLLVVALSQAAYEVLVAVLAAREVERRYLALAMGTFATPRGIIDAPIGRSTQRRTRMAVAEGGREARTEFTVLESFGDRTLVELKLQTGRTHQIRVHLAAVDHPVAGDRTYGGGRAAAACARPFLHAHRLAFDHPVTGVRVALDDPLPPELQSVLDELRAQAAAVPSDPSPST
jgi:23S rRNA pseudouridine1911/1915/1917 synthase